MCESVFSTQRLSALGLGFGGGCVVFTAAPGPAQATSMQRRLTSRSISRIEAIRLGARPWVRIARR